MNLRYVFSAPAMLRIQPSTWSKENLAENDIMVSMIKEGIRRLRKDVNSMIPGVNFDIDLLFNAYTEKDCGEWLRKYDTFGFSKLYADSGGLQIVTAGKQVNDELKSKIYATQSLADYAMCFDEIPAGSIGISNSSTNRSQTGNKIYYPEKNQETATKTAQNIKEQIDILNEYDTSTKVHYIIQGNTHQDMVDWFRYGNAVLEDKHFDKIGGMALADTCMGNGPLESIDMLVAYHRILKEFGENKTKKHIHLLGVGSIPRLMPAIYLMKSGFLPEDLTISFDSTSFSMNYIMGRFTDSNGNKVEKDARKYSDMFRSVFNYYKDIYEKYMPISIDEDEYVEYVTSQIRSVADTINNAKLEWQPLIRAHLTLTICWQVLGLVSDLKAALEDAEYDRSSVGMLQYVKTLDDYESWHDRYSKFVTSKRIYRSDASTLEEFL